MTFEQRAEAEDEALEARPPSSAPVSDFYVCKNDADEWSALAHRRKRLRTLSRSYRKSRQVLCCWQQLVHSLIPLTGTLPFHFCCCLCVCCCCFSIWPTEKDARAFSSHQVLSIFVCELEYKEAKELIGQPQPQEQRQQQQQKVDDMRWIDEKKSEQSRGNNWVN